MICCTGLWRVTVQTEMTGNLFCLKNAEVFNNFETKAYANKFSSWWRDFGSSLGGGKRFPSHLACLIMGPLGLRWYHRLPALLKLGWSNEIRQETFCSAVTFLQNQDCLMIEYFPFFHCLVCYFYKIKCIQCVSNIYAITTHKRQRKPPAYCTLCLLKFALEFHK